ncbi:hypothetical protein PRK78_005381 [Emydomyces testavorans]|uniref:Velvet domain-containing protein n=1 Tax=Emydomyces testavorans TaxID=2070801 RepID=A0AAF0DKF4_9EURO|nr:hypothetical protein PRK78_005381 [Emydomyces testavorans]
MVTALQLFIDSSKSTNGDDGQHMPWIPDKDFLDEGQSEIDFDAYDWGSLATDVLPKSQSPQSSGSGSTDAGPSQTAVQQSLNAPEANMESLAMGVSPNSQKRQSIFSGTTDADPIQLRADFLYLTMKQHPERGKEIRFRRNGAVKEDIPLDPPPVVQVHIENAARHRSFAQMANFVVATLHCAEHNSNHGKPANEFLGGDRNTQAQELKDLLDVNCWLAVFPGLNVRKAGMYFLRFALYIKNPDAATNSPGFTMAGTVMSGPFEVFKANAFPGRDVNTPLSAKLLEQGVKMRRSKVPRSIGIEPVKQAAEQKELATRRKAQEDIMREAKRYRSI